MFAVPLSAVKMFCFFFSFRMAKFCILNSPISGGNSHYKLSTLLSSIASVLFLITSALFVLTAFRNTLTWYVVVLRSMLHTLTCSLHLRYRYIQPFFIARWCSIPFLSWEWRVWHFVNPLQTWNMYLFYLFTKMKKSRN